MQPTTHIETAAREIEEMHPQARELLFGICLLIHEHRDDLLCDLSGHEGEWSLGTEHSRELLDDISRLMKTLRHKCDGWVTAGTAEHVIDYALTITAKRWNFQIEVWEAE